MAIQVGITKSELKRVQRMLATEESIVCITEAAFIKITLVARDMLLRGKDVKAKIERIQPGRRNDVLLQSSSAQ